MTAPLPNQLTIESEQEEDGRWIAEIPEPLGVLVYGTTQQTAIANVQALALRVIADKLEHGELDQLSPILHLMSLNPLIR